MKNKFLIFMATITFFLTVAVVGILLKPELYESKTTVIKENDSMQSEVDEKNIESEVSNQEEWGSGDVYDGSSPIIRKMGEKLSVIGIPHRKQGDKPPMSTEVFAYWEGEMVFTVDSAVIYDSIEKTGLNYDEFVVDFSTYDSSFKPMVVQLTIENVNARLISDPPELFSDQYVLSSKEEFSKEKFRSQNGGEWRVASGMPLAYANPHSDGMYNYFHYTIDEGETINGRELKKEMDFPESIGVLIDSPAFLDGYSAYDNLRYMASVKNKVSGEEIKDLLKKVELADAGKKKYKYFSLGMKQRLGIAAAIMEHPDIILIDEPTNALDSKGVEMVKCILQQEKERGALIVLTCHDYSVLKELSDSIYFIEEGRVVGYERQ